MRFRSTTILGKALAHRGTKRLCECIMVYRPTSRAVGRLLKEEEEDDDEIAVLPISRPDSDGPGRSRDAGIICGQKTTPETQ